MNPHNSTDHALRDSQSDQENILVIAEIGINHGGQVETARTLLREAAQAGVWGIKFQYRNLDNAYNENAREIGDEILRHEIRLNYLSPDVLNQLTDEAHDLGVAVGISFFDVGDIADFDDDLGRFDFFKIPSAELANAPLLDALIATGKHTYISTGCHNEVEIEQALSRLQPHTNWTPLHCISNYPLALVNTRLGYMRHMQKRWNRPIGYSSHDEHWETCLLSMVLGASVVERHITLNKEAQGLDHSTSSTPDEFVQICLFAENLGAILLGDEPRSPNQGELLNLQNLGRSYYAKVDIAAGQPVQQEHLVLRSPRVGMGRSEVDTKLGNVALRDVPKGDVINASVFVPQTVVSDRDIEFAREKRLSLPVRLHDFDGISKRFPVGNYEFHLSYGEVYQGLSLTNIPAAHCYSIHLPDYVSSVELMDPFSPNSETRSKSQSVLEKTAEFAERLQDLTGVSVPIVGSFSVVGGDLRTFFTDHNELFARYRQNGVSVLPQWLPPIAWYFGGSVKLEAMNAERDADLLQEMQMPFCMDVCHLLMGESFHGFNAKNVMARLKSSIEHVHIADASGFDGEGMAFGEGDPTNLPAIEAAMKLDTMKVIEVWQGHLDNGAGFAKALTKVRELFDGKC